MTVVINELEVVVADEPPAPAGGAPAAEPPALTPLEVAELLERRARQALRLFAH
ncbi:MAG TPA: hypothetical protein VFR37_19515 [Longimicrobium sp.]|nr:hypothetical protein [Longimicrobium sp.]